MNLGAAAKNIGRNFIKGKTLATSGAALATGAGAAAGGQFLAEQSEFMRKDWWRVPVAMAIVGHGMNAAGATPIGCAVLGAAGATGYWTRKLSRGVQPETSGVQSDTGDADDYVSTLAQLGAGEARGVQSRVSADVMGLQVAAG